MKTKIEVDTHPYHAARFDASIAGWTANKEYNRVLLAQLIFNLQRRLEARGHLFANEVLYEFGFKRTPSGQVCGWVLNNGPLEINVSERMSGDGDLWVTFEDQGVIIDKVWL